jgi:hypothetical protein
MMNKMRRNLRSVNEVCVARYKHVVWEPFCGIHGTQFDLSNLDAVGTFENISDTALLQLMVNETNKYTRHKILKNSGPLTLHSRIRTWKNVKLNKMFVVIAMFMLMGTV